MYNSNLLVCYTTLLNPMNVLFETNWEKLGIMLQHFLYKPKPNYEDVLAKLITNKMSCCNTSCKNRSCKNKTALAQMRKKIRRSAISMPISQKLQHVRQHIKKMSEDWDIPEHLLSEAFNKLEQLVLQKCMPIKWAIEKVSISESFMEHAVHVEEVLNHQFDTATMLRSFQEKFIKNLISL